MPLAPVVTFASAKASPGATTTALLCAAAWHGERLLIEADDSGGVLAARLGLSESPGALQLAGAARVDFDRAALRAHCQEAVEGVPLLVGPPEPTQVLATFRELAPQLSDIAESGDVTMFLDGGRLTVASPVWPVSRVGLVVLVARNCLDEFSAFSAAARDLRAGGARVAAAIVDAGPYPPDEYASTAGAELLAVLPHDASAASALRGEPRAAKALHRSALWPAACSLAERIAVTVTEAGLRPDAAAPLAEERV